MAKLVFLGLGVMGYPMAGHLVKAGHDVTVYNRTTVKAEAWAKEYGGQFATTPKAAVDGADIVCACVGNDDDLRSVCLGDDGAFAGMSEGAIFLDHTSVTGKVSVELADIAAQSGIGFVDAPVSGGQAGAENGQLVIMCGGSEADFARADTIMSAYAKQTKHMGPVGAGQMTKMVNQICIAGVLQGLAEGVHFAEKAGLDPKEVLEVIGGGSAGSWQMANRLGTMADDFYDYGFAVDWMRKDLGNCLSSAEDLGASLPMTAVIDQFYKDVQALGGGRWDSSSLLKRLKAFE